MGNTNIARKKKNTMGVAYQAPLSMGFSRQEYWNGLPSSSQGDLLNPGSETALQVDFLSLSQK